MKEFKIDMGVAKPQDFKETKFYVADAAESEQVQRAMFELGFAWNYHNSGNKREVFINKFGMQEGHWLYVDKDCRIYWDYKEIDSCATLGRPKACFQQALFDAANAFHANKRVERKEKRRRKMEKKGWIYTNGVEPTIDSPQAYEILFRNGDTAPLEMAYWIWEDRGEDYDIVAYRQIAPKLKIISLEKMLEDVVQSAGGTITEEKIVFPKDTNVDLQKETNPKRQYGMSSIPLNLWSPLASSYGAVGLYNGSLKYGQGNYKATPVEASIYIAAAMRHLNAWAEGEEYDQADGVPNLGGVLANIAILIDSRAAGTLIDDRQLPGGYLQEREKLKEIVKSLQVLHAGKTPKHFTIQDN